MKSTFLNGGYFKYKLESVKENLSLLVINANYWSFNNNESSLTSTAEDQMTWLQDVFSFNKALPKNEQEKYILMMHIYPGLNYYTSDSRTPNPI